MSTNTHFNHQIYAKALREIRMRKVGIVLSRILGFGSLGMYTLFLMISNYTDDPSFVLFSYYAVFANLSHLIWSKYFEIPQIYLNLIEANEALAKESFEIIQKHGKEWSQRILWEVFGRNPKPPVDEFSLEDWQKFLHSLERFSWKKIGKLYFVFYSMVTIFVFSFLVYRLIYLRAELSS